MQSHIHHCISDPYCVVVYSMQWILFLFAPERISSSIFTLRFQCLVLSRQFATEIVSQLNHWNHSISLSVCCWADSSSSYSGGNWNHALRVLSFWTLNLDTQKPFKGNYTRLYYISNKFISELLHAKKSEEFNGITFKVIPLVCIE